jgi:hypothetical protein
MASNKEIKMLRANYEHMLQSPVFAKMQRRVRSLEKERKSLRRVIVELGYKLDVGIKHVVIKTEPCEVIDLTQNESENVKYELEEESDEFMCDEDVVKVSEEEESCEEEEEVEESEEEDEGDGARFGDIINNDEEEEEEEEVEVEESEEVEVEESEEEEVEESEEEEVEVEESEEEEVEVEESEEEEVEVEESEEEEVEVEESEEEEVEVEESGEEEEEEVEVEESGEEEEEEVFEVVIKGKSYYTTDTQNGEIYAVMPDGDVGDEVGKYKNGVAKFTA